MKKLQSTKEKILTETIKIYAIGGHDEFSIRKLAKQVGIAQSVIYHHFENKEVLLKYMFRQTSEDLGKKRRSLPETDTAAEMLMQRVEFQLEHAMEVTAVLKYFFAHRDIFPKIKSGYVPDKAYLHILEVLNRGVKNGEFIEMNKRQEAKVITHAINGFVMEYFPDVPTGADRKKLVEQISTFVLRSIVSKG